MAEKEIIKTTVDIDQAVQLYFNYARRHQLQYAFNGTDAKVYQSNRQVLYEQLLSKEIDEIINFSILLDHIQYINFVPSQQIQPIYSQFRQSATQYQQIPTYISGKIGFNYVSQSTMNDLVANGIQYLVKQEDKVIYRLNSLIFKFSNSKVVQHESFIVLNGITVFSQEYNTQTDSLPQQEVYTFIAEDIIYCDRQVNIKKMFQHLQKKE